MSAAAPQLQLASAAWAPKANPWLITIAVMLGTFMEVLDTSVANVALPHIAGSMASSIDEATWVLTSYLVSNAIVLPITGWLGRVFGRKNFLMFCICLFTFASLLCGAATTLPLLIAARVLQGGQLLIHQGGVHVRRGDTVDEVPGRRLRGVLRGRDSGGGQADHRHQRDESAEAGSSIGGGSDGVHCG